MSAQKVYSRLTEIIAEARKVATEIGDLDFEANLKNLEIMTLDRLYVAMDGIESGRRAANQRQRLGKTRRHGRKAPSAMKKEAIGRGGKSGQYV